MLQLHDQFGLAASPLLAVAGVAEQLQVVDVVGSAFGLGNNMIDGEVLEREGDAATVAKALLLAEQFMLVGLVRRQFANVFTFGNVFAVYKVAGLQPVCAGARVLPQVGKDLCLPTGGRDDQPLRKP